ncbi:MAG: AAA family ATPase [Actinomycetaceae bacterium]|nr:AAA family ATPase [Actinomycetaceae bacterium]MDY5272576.1 AAA family ATPase [Arcanobacterium sp.]
MYLKTLTLRGFKSFATATTLRFEPGINCVVGPNGSGKSNVVDALAWVMGEQGARALRGGNMADVIFAGTAARPALGRAEVSLTIDNTDGALPIEFSEVTISRTLFRSGGSEYAINGTACRLLDIQELLSDTGMGKEMHVIIGQGKLDEVLTATPEERRGFVEEAAGVLKHRRRKEKALRKLDSMQANLTRVEDLAAELRRQLGPLARQAATARRAQVIQRDVFDARARLLADDLAQAQARVAAHTAGDAELLKRRSELGERVEQLRTRVQELQEQADRLSPYTAQLAERFGRLTSLLERFRSLADLAAERERSLNAPAPNTQQGETPEHIRERAQIAREEEANLAEQVQAAQQHLAQMIANREKADQTEADVDAHLARINRTLADRREMTARIAGQITAARSRIEALTAERERVDAAKTEAEKRAQKAAQSVAQLERDTVAHTPGNDDLSLSHQRAAHDVQEAQAKVEEARSALAQAQANAVQWRTKAETLSLSLVPEDATAWVVDNFRTGVDGLVRDSLRITPGWETGVEAALAGSATGAVVTDIDAGIDALRAAREEHAGHLELIVSARSAANEAGKANGSRNGEANGNGEDGSNDDSAGVLSADVSTTGSERGGGRASRENITASMASADAANGSAAIAEALEMAAERAIRSCQFGAHEAVVASSVIMGTSAPAQTVRELLSGTVLCVDLLTARSLIRAGAPSVATLAGDVLSPGRVRGGEVQAAAVLARQAMYDDALAQARQAEQEHSEAEDALVRAQRVYGDFHEKFEQISSELNARDSQLAALTAQLGVLRQSLEAAQAEAERDRVRIGQIDAELSTRRSDLEAINEQQLQLSAEPEDLTQRAAELTREREQSHSAAVTARQRETEARLALRTHEERLRAIAGKSEALERGAQAAQERIRHEERMAIRRAQARQAAHEVGEKARRAFAVTQQFADSVEREREQAEAQGAQQHSQLVQARAQFDQASAEERALADEGHQRELALAQQKLKYEQLEQRAMETMGMEAATLIDEYGPHLPIPVGSPVESPGGEPPTSPANDAKLPAGDTGGSATGDAEAVSVPPATIPFVRAEQEKRLARAERDLARLGKINPLALEEHAALEQRQKFLTEQLHDLRRSREDLLKMIRDIDQRVEDVMAAALADVAEQFTGVFARLFPGGEGKLVLTDPDSILTTGIDIEARPPGKRVKRLSLLSGGERSLTAIAFLMAIFMARPSPFYVMDEVEAALDDVNLSRLLDLFEQLHESSQLLIITHQKRTMEIADALYGVAMRERGVTSVISQRIADVIDA